jgi:prepilin-type N-terminal cleavage/methylation domain-containing protein
MVQWLGMAKYKRFSGFTLVEMSMVLVIIGLITGAILVGYNLVLAAKIRQTVTQMERLVTASYTFKAKYNWMPGDMIPSQAQLHGLTHSPCFDGSGIMFGDPPDDPTPDGCSAYAWPTTGNDLIDEGTQENANYYTHLSLAGLIEGQYGFSFWEATGDQTKVWQEPAVRRGVIYPATCADPNPQKGNRHCFLLGASFMPATGTTQLNAAINQITPFETYSIDVKIDDGKPATGRLRVLVKYAAIGRKTNGDVGTKETYITSENCCRAADGSSKFEQCDKGDSDYDIANEGYLCMVQSMW